MEKHDYEFTARVLAGDLLKAWNEQDAKLMGGNHAQRVEDAARAYLTVARRVFGLIPDGAKHPKQEEKKSQE